MAAGQYEVSFFVFRQRECRGPVAIEIVAAIAGVEIRSGYELTGMTVRMTVRAFVELHLEQSVLALGNVTFSAFHAGVLPLQRISTCGVILHREQRWAPSLYRMATRAFACAGAL